MSAGKYNIKIEEGANFATTITWKEDDTAIDITGYTGRMYIRKNGVDGAIILELTTENGRMVLGGVAGTIELSIDAADTVDLAFGSGVYDLELINGSGFVTRIIQGLVAYNRNVTQA